MSANEIGLARVGTGTIRGVEAIPVTVECYRGKGLPQSSLVGLARGAVREALVRVRSAISASGFKLGNHRIVANLLPAEVPKDASALDLALAVALLAACGLVDSSVTVGRRFFGELSLSGRIEASRGAVLVADLVRQRGEQELFVPRENAEEAALIPGIRVTPVDHLLQLVEHLAGRLPLAAASPPDEAATPVEPVDMSEVAGQARAKRAMEIAAAGGHNILLVGPPGSGKTMLARRLPSILPMLTADQSTEVTRIYSAAGSLGGRGRIRKPPFRAPHHTSSYTALCGGGSPVRPGEVTLAHRGVLFLDELPEFGRRAIESLREPLEEGEIHVARAAERATFPARTLVVAAMNPCPCGFYRGDRRDSSPRTLGRACVCNFQSITRYRNRISGPVLDRIDLHVVVEAVRFSETLHVDARDSSEAVRARVLNARKLQRERLGRTETNASMTSSELRRFARPCDEESTQLLEDAVDLGGLTSRALQRVQKIARTIADLEGSAVMLAAHLSEALSYRVLDRDRFESDFQTTRFESTAKAPTVGS